MTTYKTATVFNINAQGIRVTFAGETTPTLKRYKRLSSYSPTVGDRVLMVEVSGTYIILGKIE
ncbi:hypothetical protein [Natronincola ferrireducens]|uniref:Uncharacterized protein n=1 Tax=Natronincola ferrireducens TaxID=393762 RepID=A0A1G9I6J2_9FIRM|nr:hypothetical protein [Natronincola ferrireducens]SDL20857.1 hypothetical protein SAMN05660472_02813 [Natronincola ferrireducens]